MASIISEGGSNPDSLSSEPPEPERGAGSGRFHPLGKTHFRSSALHLGIVHLGGWGTVPQKGVVFVRFQLFPKCLFSVWMIILSYSTHVFSTGTFLFQFMSKLKTFQFFNGQKLPKMRHYFGWLGLGRINDTHLPIPDSHRPILELDHSRSASPVGPKAEDLSRKDLGCILVSGGVLRGQDPLTRNEERRLPYPFALPGIELISPLVFVLFLFLSLFNLTSRLWQDGKSWILSFSPEGKPCWRQLSCF